MPDRRTLTEDEYNAVRESVLKSAPPNLDEATFTKWIGPQMAAALQEAELQPAPQQGSATGRFFSGAAEMLNPIEMAKGAYQAVRHPIDTGTAIVGAMGDQWSQGIDLAKQGRVVEGVGHMAAGSIPVLGPTAAAIGEQAATGDLAGATGATAGLLAPFGVKPALQTARTMTPKGLRATIAERLEAQGARRYADVMAPTVGPNKTRFGTQAEQVAPDLAKNPQMAAWSREGLHTNVQTALDQATRVLDETADAALATKSFETAPVLDALKAARQKLVAEAIDADRPVPEVTNRTAVRPARVGDEFRVSGEAPIDAGDLTEAQRGYRTVDTGEFSTVQQRGRPIGKDVEPAPNAPRIAAVDQVIAEVEQLGPLARYESLRRIRQAWDSVAKQVYMPSPTADLLKLKGNSLGAADSTAALRRYLAEQEPRMAKANEAYSIYKTANDVLDATAEVERTRPRVGRHIIAKLTGATVGGQTAGAGGAVAGYLLGPVVDAATSSGVTVRLQTGRLMTKLAGAIRDGNVTQVATLVERLRKLAPTGAVSIAQQTAPVVAERQTNRPTEARGR